MKSIAGDAKDFFGTSLQGYRSAALVGNPDYLMNYGLCGVASVKLLFIRLQLLCICGRYLETMKILSFSSTLPNNFTIYWGILGIIIIAVVVWVMLILY